ncbi:hypothetical protein HDU98_005117 [Podochytrium sp. JEL0797]|nr:hypothetical protein HDU98_005117 [Podochytrium sp. JEL0797]
MSRRTTERAPIAAPAAEPALYPHYLDSSFDPQKATVSELKSILSECNVPFPTNQRALKADFVLQFQTHIASKSASLRSKIARVKPSSKGIEIVHSSPLQTRKLDTNPAAALEAFEKLSLNEEPGFDKLPSVDTRRKPLKNTVVAEQFKAAPTACFYAAATKKEVEKPVDKAYQPRPAKIISRRVIMPVKDPLSVAFEWEGRRFRLVPEEEAGPLSRRGGAEAVVRIERDEWNEDDEEEDD